MKLIYENKKLLLFEASDNLEVEVRLDTEEIYLRGAESFHKLDFPDIKKLEKVIRCKSE